MSLGGRGGAGGVGGGWAEGRGSALAGLRNLPLRPPSRPQPGVAFATASSSTWLSAPGPSPAPRCCPAPLALPCPAAPSRGSAGRSAPRSPPHLSLHFSPRLKGQENLKLHSSNFETCPWLLEDVERKAACPPSPPNPPESEARLSGQGPVVQPS